MGDDGEAEENCGIAIEGVGSGGGEINPLKPPQFKIMHCFDL